MRAFEFFGGVFPILVYDNLAAAVRKVFQGSKRLEIIPEEAAVVRRIFEMRAFMPAASLRQLAAQAQKEGLRPKKGQTWSAMQISRVLKNEALYRGQIQYGGITARGQHEAVL